MHLLQKSYLKILLSTLLLFISLNSHAAQFAAELGAQFGGDKLVTAVFTSGDTKSISAGDGVQVSVGAKFDITDTMFIKALVGINTSIIRATNGSINWSYTPINVMFYKKVNRWNLGAGLTLHSSPKLTGSGVVTALDVTFKDAVGYSLQADYPMGKKGYFGLKYTLMNYTASSGGTGTVNGNSFGLILGGYF